MKCKPPEWYVQVATLYKGGLSRAEIAEQMGVPIGSVCTALYVINDMPRRFMERGYGTGPSGGFWNRFFPRAEALVEAGIEELDLNRRHPPRRSLPLEDHDRAFRLRQEGFTYGEIARILSYHPSTIAFWFRHYAHMSGLPTVDASTIGHRQWARVSPEERRAHTKRSLLKAGRPVFSQRIEVEILRLRLDEGLIYRDIAERIGLDMSSPRSVAAAANRVRRVLRWHGHTGTRDHPIPRPGISTKKAA